MNNKLWSGSYSSQTSAAVDAYNSSISFDARMYQEDIAGSIAHSRMLAACGIIEAHEQAEIEAGLLEILADMNDGKISVDPASEDIHMFIEALLTERIGDSGKKLHTARSRNDQVATDLRLYLMNQASVIQAAIVKLVEATLDICNEHLTTVMPGYTHLQRAQPITLAHHLMAYVQMLLRDLDRLQDWSKRTSVSPLGAGALATSSYPIDREMTAQLLGFDRVAGNSIDAVSDRDFVVELAGILALFMVHLSRWSEEIILWASREFDFIKLDDAYSTGSSIMPQKKNPDVAELTRGKSARAISNLNTLLVMLKGIPLAYNKDMQEDKEAIFDSIDTVLLCIPAFTGMIQTAKWNSMKMLQACHDGYLNATDLADYLVGRGIPFRDAHHISGVLVREAMERGIRLDEFSLEEFQEKCPIIDQDVYLKIDLNEMLDSRNVIGGPAPATVSAEIIRSRSALLEYSK